MKKSLLFIAILTFKNFTLQAWAVDDAVCTNGYANAQAGVVSCQQETDVYDGGSIVHYRTVETVRTQDAYQVWCRSHYRDGSPSTLSLKASIPSYCLTGDVWPEWLPPLYPQCHKGSEIHMEAKAVGEEIPLTSVSFSLKYFSYWSMNYKRGYTLGAVVSGSNIRSQTTGFDVKVYNEAGTLVDHQTFSNSPNQSYSYLWNGNNSSGNPTLGLVKYKVVHQELATDYSPITTKYISIGGLKSIQLGLGGWLPSNWKYYDDSSKRIVGANGVTRSVTGTVISGGGWRVAERDGSAIYEFDSNGRLTNVRAPLTGTVVASFAYDTSGHIVSMSEPFGRITTFGYTSGLLSSITAPNGKVTTVSLDSNGYLASVTNPQSESYSMTYVNSNGLMSTFTKPNGAVSTMTYNVNGDLISDSHSGGSSSTFGTSGIYQTLTSTMGRARKEQISSSGGTSYQAVTESDGAKNEIQAATFYHKKISKDSSFTTNFANDLRWGAQTQVPSSTQRVRYGYRNATWTRTVNLSIPSDPFSIVTLVNKEALSSGGPEYTSTYTGATKTWVHKTKLNRTQTTVLDSYERVLSKQIGSQTAVTFSYSNDLLVQTAQGSRVTNMSYDPTSKLLASVTNALGETTSFSYDNAERLTSKTLPDLRVIGYLYDSQGNLVSITPPGRPVHQFSFNSHELNSGYQPPALDTFNNWNTSYTYNNDKQLTVVTRPDGQTITNNYGTITGALDSVTGAFGTYLFTYDSYRNLTQVKGPDNTYYQRYYNSSAPVGMAYFSSSGSMWARYLENPSTDGRMGSDSVTDSTGTLRTLNYSYDNDEKVTMAGDISIAYDIPDGKLTGTSLSTLQDGYTYNSYGEITGYLARNGSTALYTYTLTRDALGRISQKVETLNGVTSTFDYTYDVSGRLIQVNKNSVTVSTYVYDNNSNRIGGVINGTSTSATYDDQDRLLTYNVNAYTYNRNGELQSKTDTLLSQTTNYTYSVFGQLTSVALPSSTINYEIDPLHQRWGRKIGSTVQKRYLRDQQGRIVSELSSTNVLTKRFVYASKSHVPDYFFDTANEKYRIYTDHLGSVRLVVKLSTGTVMQLMEHDEFGRVVHDTNPGYQPFGFAGGEYDTTTGLVRFGVRDYDSETGRWLSKDPILFAGRDENLYGYVNVDPVNFIDPSGLHRNTPEALPEMGSGLKAPSGSTIYVSPNGQAAVAAPGSSVATANNGRGIVITPPGSQHGSNVIRLMEPNGMSPNGYGTIQGPGGQYLNGPGGSAVPSNSGAAHIQPPQPWGNGSGAPGSGGSSGGGSPAGAGGGSSGGGSSGGSGAIGGGVPGC